MSADAKYAEAFRQRFPDREELEREALFEHFVRESGVTRQDVAELMDLLNTEVGIPYGLLRPGDSMDVLFEAIPTRNPLRWIEHQTRAADAKTELNHQLRKRMERLGTLHFWDEIPRIGDLVRAWAGRLPNSV
jgi:hypothetical protein